MTETEHTKRTRAVAGLLGAVVWANLLVILASALAEGVQTGESPLAVVVFLTSFFTIWTNAAVGLTLTVPLVWPETRLGHLFRRHDVLTAVAASITFVMVTYHLLLSSQVDPEGIALLTDVLAHYLVPVSFVGYWWVVSPKETLRWRDPLVWLSYPLAYQVHVFVRGALTGFYPYPFVDVASLGFVPVLRNTLGTGAAFVVISLAFVAVGRVEMRWNHTPQEN
jgi:hypothetical protein